ncbi:MAG: serine hydrolase domain-containing protein, partial [Acidobacteriota bacterium]
MKRTTNKFIIIFLLSSLLFFSDLVSDTGDSKGKNYRKLQSIIRDTSEYIPSLMKKSNCPGLAVILVNREGVLWKSTFGFTGAGQNKIINYQTIFSIQSMSKSFTALGVLNGVSQGLLDLDKPVTEYLPDFRVNSYFEKNPESIITLRILLSHRSGLPHEAPVGNNYKVKNHSFKDHIQSISLTWLRFKVNERYSYSNLGIDLAGYILGKVSGLGFEEYMEKNIFTPAGMNSSTFNLEKIKKSSNRAFGTDRYIKETPVNTTMIPSGGLYTNILDLALFMGYAFDPDKEEYSSLPGSELLEEMYRIPLMMWDNNSGYGLGIVKEFRNGTYLFTHSGGGFGFNSDMRWYPESGFGVAVLTNTADNISTGLSNMILDRIMKETVLIEKFLRINPVIHSSSGRYRIKIHGQPLGTITLSPGNGNRIILNDPRSGKYILSEKIPFLYFSENGTCLDLSGTSPLWNNVPLEKIELHKVETVIIYLLLVIFTGSFIIFFFRYIIRKFRKVTVTDPAAHGLTT